ncbi:NCS2 family permease [Aminipila luticellarii]|uniref:NCS2 family permease n=1 Tax=Aminipila luticellarii TaxID=2507160 RepID=A0A410PUA6_9FIRM|nr:NCS2 family permease [Aminipila luticellarii]QAT42509.1 NCS2 family permease [Aminipila luticellarii]
MERFFKLQEHHTDVKTEITAGITTFLSMAYILAVNPAMLADAGMNSGGVFTATAISAAVGTLIMAFFTNYPVALASGMGLNAYFTYSVCIPLAEQGIEDPWKIALAAVFVEGLIFILLTLCRFREKLINDVPKNLKYGITVGIGLFITLIGLSNAGIVIASSSTLVDLGSVPSAPFALAFLGFLVICILHHYKVICPILWGILVTWGVGMLAQKIGWYTVNPNVGQYSVFPDFNSSGFIPEKPALFAFDFGFITKNFIQFAVIVFSFLFVELFDTVGGLIGIADKADLLDEDGKLPQASRALMADAVGTVAGACLGTSTVTAYMESCAGVGQGGRTGLTAVTTAVFFMLALFFSPVFIAIPGFATAPALIFVGWLMMNSIKKMSFEGDPADSIGGFIAMIMMPFTYSIANGIMFGILSWVILKLCSGKMKDIPAVMWVSSLLFILRIITMIF